MNIFGHGGNSKDMETYYNQKATFYDDNSDIPYGIEIYNGVGSAGDNETRNKVYRRLKNVKNTIMTDKICTNVKLGNNLLINWEVQIHHDCVIGNDCVIAPGAILLGNVTLEDNVYIGAGAIIKQGVRIGQNAVIGMGSIVLKDIPANEVWVGNPAKFLRKK